MCSKGLVSVLLSCVLLSSCAVTGLYSRTGPAAIMVMKESSVATSHHEVTRTGEACSMNILGIVSIGDSSVMAAKLNGRVTRVASLDHDIMNILFLFGRVCTIVQGS